jgi:hypothetical protein
MRIPARPWVVFPNRFPQFAVEEEHGLFNRALFAVFAQREWDWDGTGLAGAV